VIAFNLLRYFEKKPIVVVSCLRDIHLLSLQAQSIHKHLSSSHDIYILVNEKDNVGDWNLKYDRYCKHWYANHNVTVIYKKDFDCNWSRNGNYKFRGWEDQQILKLAVSELINYDSYFVLDSQNFLIKKWNTKNYPIIQNKIPNRNSNFTMSSETYHEYCKFLEITPNHFDKDFMSISTPLFLKTSLVRSLIGSNGGIKSFSKTFFNFKHHPSEFLLYFLWAEKQGGFYKHHYDVKQSWNGPMVRYMKSDWTLDNLFEKIEKTQGSWISITNDSWKFCSADEKQKLSNILKNHGLDLEESGI
jgi:hypothetical protein